MSVVKDKLVIHFWLMAESKLLAVRYLPSIKSIRLMISLMLGNVTNLKIAMADVKEKLVIHFWLMAESKFLEVRYLTLDL